MSINVQFNQFDDGKWKQHDVSMQATRTNSDQLGKAFNNQSNDDDFTFWDFLDIINPLQHIPVVNTLYRSITGDTIKPQSNIIGGTLFGGVTGAASAVVNEIVREGSGKDMGGHVMAMAGIDDLGKTFGLHADEKIEFDQAPTETIYMVAQADPESKRQDYDTNQHPLDTSQDILLEIRAKNYVDHQGNTIVSQNSSEPQAHNTKPQNMNLNNQTSIYQNDLALIMMQNLDSYADMKTHSNKNG